jgi:hypothetical protein
MSLTKEQKKIVRDAILVIDEERIRLMQAISDAVIKGIKLRKIVDELEETRNKLAPMVQSKKKVVEVPK